MNGLLIATLVAYMAHSIFVHWRQGPESDTNDTHLHRGLPIPLMPVMLFFICQSLGTPVLLGWIQSPWTWGISGLLYVWIVVRQIQKRPTEHEDGGILGQLSYLLGGVLQALLLLASCYLAYQSDAIGRSLFPPQWVILGLFAGHLIFGVSLCFSHRSLDSLRDIARYTFSPGPVLRHAAQSPRQVFACIDVSLMEEIIYRVAAQGALIALLGNVPLAVIIVAVVFSVVHRHFFYNHIADSLEFLAFSLLLGVVYYWTQSLMLVVMIHTVRNFEIVYFDQTDCPLTPPDAPSIPAEAHS